VKFDVDLGTGTVRAEFTLAEAQEILDALAAARGTAAPAQHVDPRTRPVWVLMVDSETKPGVAYETRIWFNSTGKHGTCQCGDNTYRHNWCKHLVDSDRRRQARLAALS